MVKLPLNLRGEVVIKNERILKMKLNPGYIIGIVKWQEHIQMTSRQQVQQQTIKCSETTAQLTSDWRHNRLQYSKHAHTIILYLHMQKYCRLSFTYQQVALFWSSSEPWYPWSQWWCLPLQQTGCPDLAVATWWRTELPRMEHRACAGEPP